MIYKLLIESGNGNQDIVKVEVSGGYYGPGIIRWDERSDGPMRDDVVLGAMVRVGNNLEIDGDRLTTLQTSKLTLSKRSALLEIDSSNDAIIDAAIGRRDTEYLQAEKQAAEYVAAGYSGDTYPYVHSWAAAKGESEQWAADNILETATAWRTIQADMRGKRLKAKEGIRNATSQNEVDSIITQWSAYIDIIKQQLGA